jgi:Mrp family chromosome partitioning ATPase
LEPSQIILTVIRHAETRFFTEMVLESAGHRVIESEGFTQAESLLNALDPELILIESASSSPLELMQSKKLGTLMDQLSLLFDWIIVDSPPILPLADASVWTRIVDGILLVTRRGTTKKKQLERALQALGPDKLVGAVLNCSQASAYSSYYYYKTAAAS